MSSQKIDFSKGPRKNPVRLGTWTFGIFLAIHKPSTNKISSKSEGVTLSQPTPQHVSQPKPHPFCNAIIKFCLVSLDRKSLANYAIHNYYIVLVQALVLMRLVTSFPAQIDTRRQESTFAVKKLFLAIIHSQNMRQ